MVLTDALDPDKLRKALVHSLECDHIKHQQPPVTKR